MAVAPGSVCWSKFPYSDLSGEKVRPVVVLSILDGDDVIVCMITSKTVLSKYAVNIDQSSMIKGKVRPSIIRPDKLFTADKCLLQELGTLSRCKLDEIIKQIQEIFFPPKP